MQPKIIAVGVFLYSNFVSICILVFPEDSVAQRREMTWCSLFRARLCSCRHNILYRLLRFLSFLFVVLRLVFNMLSPLLKLAPFEYTSAIISCCSKHVRLYFLFLVILVPAHVCLCGL